MQVIGVIAEYNPFHNGHLYHIKTIKELYPDSLIILIIDNYFLQRGEVSLLTKEDKTKIALDNNVDIVLELPVMYAMQSADYFAYKSIEILNYFNIDRIIFGSESNNINILEKIAKAQLSDSFENEVKKYLKEGINYPTALAKAIDIDFDYNNPNDLLAISYIKAILQINKNIKYESIKRTSDYHDLKSTNSIISASNIRNKINNNEKIDNYLPIESKNNIKDINYDLLFELLKYKINTEEKLEKYLDVDEGIEKRLKNYINKVNNYEDYVSSIKTKRYTYNKINRMLIHILLDFKKIDNDYELKYINILGFNNRGQAYINSIKKTIDISLKKIKETTCYSLEYKASIIYDLLTKSDTTNYEINNKPTIKNKL